MSYEDFEHRVHTLFGNMVMEVKSQDGRHIAKLRGGIQISGNSIAPSVMIRWGNGHYARAKNFNTFCGPIPLPA